MTLTTLDERPALIVIDLQRGVAGRATVHPVVDVVRRAASLAAAFRARGWPVVLVNVTGGAPGRTDAVRARVAAPPDYADLLDELGAQPSDLRVTKQRWGAFHDTALDEDLRSRGVTQVVLVGISTSVGVETTARAAFEHGYHVVLVVDAMTDTDDGAHANSVEKIFPRLGEVTSTDEVLAMMGVRS